MRRGRLTALAFWLAYASGCAGGTETGNPSFEGQLAYDAYSSDVTAVALRSASSDPPSEGATLVDSVWLVLGDISFDAEGECASGTPSASVHATGIGEGDHAAQGRVVTAVALASGEYCGLQVPLELAPAMPLAGPVELGEHSILIHGALPDGRSFQVLSDMQGMIDLASETPFEMSARAGTVLIGFDLAVWIDAIDWSSATTEGGAITIDREHNSQLLGAFEDAIARGTGLYRSDATSPIDIAHPLALGQ